MDNNTNHVIVLRLSYFRLTTKTVFVAFEYSLLEIARFELIWKFLSFSLEEILLVLEFI